MSKRSVSIELPEDIWNIIDNFKLNGETESEIISNIVKDCLVHGYDQEMEDLIDVNKLKDLVEVQHDSLMSLKDLLQRKGLITHQEWAQIMQERLIKNEVFLAKELWNNLFLPFTKNNYVLSIVINI
ncbi:MAG TPA: hypothetical protein VJ799_14320 [Nitrososphaeraceae archaeon]|nr:hypothetical protein [Nitrososphaeraceae archaeon]